MIELAKANPDLETLKMTLWMAGFIISALFAVVIYFVKNQDASRKTEMEKITSIIETLTETVNSLKTIVEVIKSRQSGDGEFCHMKHTVIDNRLNDHSKRLDLFDNRVTKIETKMEK